MKKRMKRRGIGFGLFFYVVIVVLNIIVAVKLSKIFADFSANNFIISSIIANIPFLELSSIRQILFIIYCLAVVGMLIFEVFVNISIEEDGTWGSMGIEIITLGLVLIVPSGLSAFNSVMSWGTLIASIPLAIGVGFLVEAETIIGKIFLFFLVLILFVITMLLEVFLALLVKRFLYFLCAPEESSSTSKKTSQNGSLREDLGRAADMYVDMKNAENLQKTADELERIRFQMSRKN